MIVPEQIVCGHCRAPKESAAIWMGVGPVDHDGKRSILLTFSANSGVLKEFEQQFCGIACFAREWERKGERNSAVGGKESGISNSNF